MPRPSKHATLQNHVCFCDEEDSSFDDMLPDDEFEKEPCPKCRGRVLRKLPTWMLEEEDD